MIILACDPGIDLATAATFDLAHARRPGTLDGAAAAYRAMSSARTRPADPMPARLHHLFAWMQHLVESEGAARLVIEVPHSAGTYRGKQGRQASKTALNAGSLVKMERAIAALQLGAAAAGAEVVEIPARYPAIWARKPARHEALADALRAAGQTARLRNADERDAAFVGIYYLSSTMPR